LHLNHLSLAVPDVSEASRFFETFFDFRCVDSKGADVLAVLEGQDGFTLVLSHLDKEAAISYPKDFHIGFILENQEQVQATFERLQSAGITLPHAPRIMRSSFIFYCHVLETILLEVSCGVK
jgi:catechol 2,3-dioxygenase-like lactoylglutathione lyase family enzyme